MQVSASMTGCPAKDKLSNVSNDQSLPQPTDLIRLLIEICQPSPRDEHFHAIQLICSSALEYYRGVLKLVEDENALAAKVLSRTLLETLVTLVILAKYPAKLPDFKDHGRYAHLRTLKLSGWAVENDARLASKRDRLLAKDGTDYHELERKFRNKAWHGFKRSAAFMEAGFDFDLYDAFYRPMSEMTHGEPFIYLMLDPSDELILGRSDLKEARYLAGAVVSSSSLLLHALRRINQLLGLQFGERLEAIYQSFLKFGPVYKDFIMSMGKEDRLHAKQPTKKSVGPV
jgi:hypothetical protein